MMKLSIIFPMYNEQGNVEELLNRTISTLEVYYKNGSDFEIICVDDGSQDGTRLKLIENRNLSSQIRLVSLPSHRGHAKAIEAGFQSLSTSQYTILSNADLQYKPEELPNFLEFAKNHPNLVIINGWRYDKIDPLLKNAISRIYNRLYRFLFDTNLHDHASNYILFKTKYVRNLSLGFDDQRYLIALLKNKFALNKDQICEIRISHLPRKSGKSKYPAWKKVLVGFLEILVKRIIFVRKRKKNSI